MPPKTVTKKEELLVGIVHTQSDFEIIQNQHWYRVPVEKVNKNLKKRWPPKRIAFYYTNSIKDYPHMIIHYAKVSSIIEATRQELFPEKTESYKSKRSYYKISFKKVEELPKPILSRRWRRIVFIQTTYKKFINAVEVNDLFDESHLEDRLWAEFKRNRVSAERQQVVKIDEKFYFLDFAIHCKKGKLDIETDGDRYHHNPEAAAKDNVRNNDLTSNGWNVIRFDSQQIHEKMEVYCLPTIMTNINKLGGIEFDEEVMKRFKKQNPDLSYPTYFEEYE
jgi:very-short-patch-repair endonuclease